MGHALLTELITLLAMAVFAVAVVTKLRLPSVIGYLFVGLFVGPYALGLVEHSETTHTLGEIGVAFLLFAIGLEFSIPQFLKMRHTLIWLGGAQVLVGTICGTLIALWIGIPFAAAIVMGGALSMSSTAIVVKQLTDQGELQLRHGNLSLGILLFQDLAAVPFLVIIPLLNEAGNESMVQLLVFAFLKAIAVFAVMLTVGNIILRPLFHKVAATQSKELFTLTVLFVSSCAAWVTNLIGLSLALGAFLAGMMLAETEFRHHIDRELRPFRDLLLGVFFITVGMQLNLSALWSEIYWILLLVAGVTLGKGMLITLLALIYNKSSRVAARVGLVLGHGGEFGLALLTLAFINNLIGEGQNQIILASIVISMFIAPLLVRYNQRMTDRFEKPISQHRQLDEIGSASQDIADHVLICGFGRVGSQIATLLKQENVEFLAVDQNTAVVKAAWEDGLPVFYADAAESEVLDALGLMRAKAVVISFNDESLALQTLKQIKAHRPMIPVLVRSHDETSLARLVAAGAIQVLPETFETGLMLTLNLLLILGFSEEDVDKRLHTERARLHLSHAPELQ